MARYAFLARQVDQTAAVLAVPEVAWTAFATVLSTAVAAKTANLPKRCRAAVPREEASSADSPDLSGTTELGRPTPLRAESAIGAFRGSRSLLISSLRVPS
jgi:hypothetical protein